MMKLITLLGLGLLGLALTAASEPPIEPLPVTGLGLPKKASIAEPPVARVSGHYPTPLWQFHHWDVQLKGHTLELTPYGVNQQKADQMVAQVALPFQLPKVLTGLRAGKYTVVLKGKGKSYSAPLEMSEAAMEKGLPYVDADAVEVPKSAPAGQAVTIKVSGNLPDTAWKPLAGEAKVGDGIVWVYPWAERKRSAFAAEMLKPAEWSIPLPALPEGDYLVVVEGRSQTQRSPLKITAPPKGETVSGKGGKGGKGHR